MSEQWMSDDEVELCNLRREVFHLREENKALRSQVIDKAGALATAVSLMTLARAAQCVNAGTHEMARTPGEAVIGFELEERIRHLGATRVVAQFEVELQEGVH